MPEHRDEFFYVVVGGWTIDYFVKSLRMVFTPQTDFAGEFNKMVSSTSEILFYTVLFLVINGAVILAGVRRGIERTNKILMSVLFFIGITMVTTCIFQSTGKATGAFLLSAGRQGYIYAVVLVIASAIAGYNGVICAQPIADVLAAVLAIVLYRRLLGRELA